MTVILLFQTERKNVKDECDKKVKDLEKKLSTASTTAAATVAARRQSKVVKEDTANTKALQKKVTNLESLSFYNVMLSRIR